MTYHPHISMRLVDVRLKPKIFDREPAIKPYIRILRIHGYDAHVLTDESGYTASFATSEEAISFGKDWYDQNLNNCWVVTRDRFPYKVFKRFTKAREWLIGEKSSPQTTYGINVYGNAYATISYGGYVDYDLKMMKWSD